ncbi:MAG TPA: hypothetical protein VJQ61_15970 [Sinomonas sp.]|nr:hypothetical protein [Sinomonas sp.]
MKRVTMTVRVAGDATSGALAALTALGDEGIPFEEAGYGESASQGDHVKFSVAGVDSDGRTVEFFARDWDEFDQQFEAAFGRQRGPGDRVEAQRLDDGAP